MFWLLVRIFLLIIFLFSVIQLYLDPNIGYLIVVFTSFVTFISTKGPIVQAAEKLNSPSQKDVDESIEALKHINSFASKLELTRAMDTHKNPIVSRKAAIALAGLGDKRAIKGLIKHIPNSEIIDALKTIKVIANKKLRLKFIEKIKDDRSVNAIHELGRLGGSDSVPHLQRHIRNQIEKPDDAKVSSTIAAIQEAGNLKDQKFAPDLIELFDFAMKKRIEYETLPILGDRYTEMIDDLLKAIILAFGNIGDPRSTEIISKIIQHPDRDFYDLVKKEMVIALSKIGNEEAVKLLIDRLKDSLQNKIELDEYSYRRYLKDSDLALLIIKALEDIQNPIASDVLAIGLGSSDNSVRAASEKALRGILPGEDLDKLVSKQRI